MASLRGAAAVLALVVAAPAGAQTVARRQLYITEASLRFGVPASWIEQVMRAESGGRTTLGGRPIRSRAGAIGLMQVMPGTWAAMRGRLGLGDDPDDPHDNILAGACYLRLMYDRFGYPGLFAAYNAGPARYAAYLAKEQQLPRETVAYLAKAVPLGTAPLQSASAATPDRLFALRHDQSATVLDTQTVSLFAVRHTVP
ncbi:lytic transglycosylase domain-containing protein [Sphingomonas koreensis]|nr:lytic transglycosylase domain-containing protein [Sphingomonas koreensis]